MEPDKGRDYLDAYAPFLGPLRDRPVRLLEIGVGSGASLRLWRDYFPNGIVAGLDRETVAIDDASSHVRIYRGLQEDVALLDRIGAEAGPFDVIVDDASHVAEATRVSFWHLARHHLNPRGFFIVEDWGTGYWDSWPDGRGYEGRNHIHGMVAFVKELVDEVGMEDITKPGRGLSPPRAPLFRSMHIFSGHVLLQKA